MSVAYLSVNQVAAQLAVSKMTVYRRIEAKELIAFRIGRSYRIDERDFIAYLRANRNVPPVLKGGLR